MFPFAKKALSNLFKKPSTVRFPEVEVDAKPAYRGRIVYDPEKCVNCGMCIKVCSPGAITRTVEEVEGGEKITYDINLTSCTFCGTCQDFCGTKAISLSDDYHMVAEDPKDLIVTGSRIRKKVAGRVTAGSAFFGNLFHVHPVLIADKAGHNNAIKKVNGTKGVLSYLVKAAVDAAENIEEQTVYLAGFDADASVEFMKNELLKLAKPKEVYVGNLGPILGASTGPGTVAIFVYGKEVCLEIEA